MMDFEQIETDLTHIKNFFKDFIIESNYMISPPEITWKNYSPGISKFLYSREYTDLVNKRQYSFLLKDKSFFQFYYNYNKEKVLTKAKLAYYPMPVSLIEEDVVNTLEGYYEEENDIHISEYYFDLWQLLDNKFNTNSTLLNEKIEELSILGQKLGLSKSELYDDWIQNKYSMVNTSHIRIDYDSKVESHNKVEIQFGGINYIRFPFDRLIMPFIFFEFIIKHLFKIEYKNISSKLSYKVYRDIVLKKSAIIEEFIEENIFITHK